MTMELSNTGIEFPDDSKQTKAAPLFNPTTYSGEESITYPNGLILKIGLIPAGSSSPTQINFATPFTTEVKSVQLTDIYGAALNDSSCLSAAPTVTGISVRRSAPYPAVYYAVWGR